MRKVILLVLVCFVASVFFSNAYAEQRAFVGVAKCKTCHKKPAAGEQFRIWSESAHAKAFATLASEEAIAIGKKVGVDEPQKSDTCLRCHVTGHGVAAEFLGPKHDPTQGVGCESCHGAGADYKKKKTMVAIRSGEIDGATVGLMKPNEETCVKCHNDGSPTFKSFNYEEMVKKIAHPVPEAEKAAGSK